MRCMQFQQTPVSGRHAAYAGAHSPMKPPPPALGQHREVMPGAVTVGNVHKGFRDCGKRGTSQGKV